MNIPTIITKAMSTGAWRNPGPDSLRQFLGLRLGYPELELFEEIRDMKSVWSQLDVAGYPDDPEFCMTREPVPGENHRLVFENALFIAGATLAGEDVFVALDQTDSEFLFAFDWDQPVPRRWVTCGTLTELVNQL